MLDFKSRTKIRISDVEIAELQSDKMLNKYF